MRHRCTVKGEQINSGDGHGTKEEWEGATTRRMQVKAHGGGKECEDNGSGANAEGKGD